MTDIRELLREATDDVVVTDADPVGRVRRATTRHRRTWIATVAVVAAVAAAIAVPLALTGSSPTSPAGPTKSHAVVQPWGPEGGEVAAGFGSIWGLQCCGGTTPSWVDQLDPTTGRRIARIKVPGPAAHVAAGAGRIWTIGANAGGGGVSSISAIDPATSTVNTLRLPNPQAEPYDMAFADGSAWVTMQLLNQVWRLTATPVGITKSVVSIRGGPNEIATTGNGALWVQRQDINRLSRIIPTNEGGRIGATARWSGSIYGPASGDVLWGGIGHQESATELNPGQRSHCAHCFAQGNGVHAPGQVLVVLAMPRGLVIGTDRGTYFYDFRAVESDAQQATASVPYADATSLAADGTGVVIGDGDGGLIRWIPAG